MKYTHLLSIINKAGQHFNETFLRLMDDTGARYVGQIGPMISYHVTESMAANVEVMFEDCQAGMWGKDLKNITQSGIYRIVGPHELREPK